MTLTRQVIRIVVLIVGIAVVVGCSSKRNRAGSEDEKLARRAAQLSDSDPTERMFARFHLMRAGRPAIPYFLKALQHNNPSVRYEAAAGLCGMNLVLEPDTVPILVEALGDADPCIRADCLRVLARMGPRGADAAPAVRAAIDAEEYLVRATAVETLAAILQGEAVPDLMKALSNPRTCTPAAIALGELGADARIAVPQLQDIAENGPPGAKKAAGEALNRIEHSAPTKGAP
jgi:HEAT repeat protein